MNSISLKIEATCLCHGDSSSLQPDNHPCSWSHTTSCQTHDTHQERADMPAHEKSNQENKYDITSLLVEHMGWENYWKQCLKIATAENSLSTPCRPQCHPKSSITARAATHHASAAAQACWRKIQTTVRLLCQAGQSIRQWPYQVNASPTYCKNVNPPNDEN